MAAVASTAAKTGAPGPPPAGPAPLAREASLVYDPCWAGPGEETAGDGVTAGNRRPTLPAGRCGDWAGMAKGGPGRIGAVAPRTPPRTPEGGRP